jgi:integrase
MNQLPTDSRPSDSRECTQKVYPRSKRHLAYWEHSIFQRRPKGNWHMILQHGGERRKISLSTDNKTAAAEKARNVYLAVLSDGWEAAVSALRGIERPAPTEATVGEFLEELKAKADLKPETLKGYAVAFRAIIEEIFDLKEGGKEKFDYKSGGHARWLERIHSIRLADVTPARVQAWKRAFIARAGDDPLKQRSARTSFNSFLRRAKSLFAPKCVKHLSIALPSPLPFDGIAFEPKQSSRYRSSIDAAALTIAAQRELAEEDEPVYLAFLLALGAGLRRGEIDRLQWGAFRWDHHAIRIEPTAHFEPKTEHSIADVAVDSELMNVFKAYTAQAAFSFVIEGPETASDQYRAKEVFERLSKWLRKHGVTARKPIHELRKEFGSMINRRHGLSAASDQLRHSGIAITAAYYIDAPRRATSGLGALLETEGTASDGKIISLPKQQGSL